MATPYAWQKARSGTVMSTRYTNPDGSVSTVESLVPQRINASAPPSDRNAVANPADILGRAPRDRNGLTDSGAWNAFFHPERLAPAAPSGAPSTATAAQGVTAPGAIVPPDSLLNKPATLSLAPTTPPNAAGMAEHYINSAIAGSTAALTKQGITPPAPPFTPQTFGTPMDDTTQLSFDRPAVSGDSLVSKYGTGSVTSGADYTARLKRLAQNNSF